MSALKPQWNKTIEIDNRNNWKILKYWKLNNNFSITHGHMKKDLEKWNILNSMEVKIKCIKLCGLQHKQCMEATL